MSELKKNIPLRPPTAAPLVVPSATSSEAPLARYLSPRNHGLVPSREPVESQAKSLQTWNRNDLPISLEDAQSQLTFLSGEIERVRSDMVARTEDTFSDHEEYSIWKKRAGSALGHMKARRIVLQQWIRKTQEQLLVTEKTNFVDPSSREDAKTRLATAQAELELAKAELEAKTREDFPDNEGYTFWKQSTNRKITGLKVELSLLSAYLGKCNAEKSKKARKEAALDLIEQLTGAPSETVVDLPPIELPLSIEDGEAKLTQIMMERLSVQGELSLISSTSQNGHEWRLRRKDAVQKMKNLEARQTFLKAWLKQERKKQNDVITEHRNAMLHHLDPANPDSLILHVRELLGRILRANEIKLSDQDQIIMEGIAVYLRRKGLFS